MPEYAQELIQKGELTQEEYDKWGPSGGMGYFTFNFDLTRTMESIEDGIVSLYRQEHDLYGNNYFYIEYAGIQQTGSQQKHVFILYR